MRRYDKEAGGGMRMPSTLDFNLLVTTFRGVEHEASSELYFLLKGFGDESPQISLTKVSGLIACLTNLSPFSVVRLARERIHSEPWSLRCLLRLIPVERVVDTQLASISGVAEELSLKIPEGDSFRITVDKRFTALTSNEIIIAAAAKIRRPVKLEDPDWVVLIEVVGGKTGVSVLRPDEILSVPREKRSRPTDESGLTSL